MSERSITLAQSKKQTKFFLTNMKTHTNFEIIRLQRQTPNTCTISFKFFTKGYVLYLSSFQIFESLYNIYPSKKTINFLHFTNVGFRISNLIKYYATLGNSTGGRTDTSGFMNIPFHTFTKTDYVIFSKPKKQLFIVLFNEHPTFLFTCGLMRLIMHEKRKSSKKLYKVAISLVKLSTILLLNNRFLTGFLLKLNSLGQFRHKILQIFYKSPINSRINYVYITFKLDHTSQKYNTRRSIKKYVRKRFKPF